MNAESCINTVETLRRLALNVHGVIDVVDDENCNYTIELLKAHEAVEPQRAPFPDASRSDGSWYYICGTCSKPIDPKDKYCRHCGRAVNWEYVESKDKQS